MLGTSVPRGSQNLITVKIKQKIKRIKLNNLSETYKRTRIEIY